MEREEEREERTRTIPSSKDDTRGEDREETTREDKLV